jgi:hypothetical protein
MKTTYTTKDILGNGLITLTSVFIMALVISNIMATKIWTIWGLMLPAGVIAYPITFLMTDVIGEIWGKKVVTKVVWAGFICCLFALLLEWIAVQLPAAPFYNRQEMFSEMFGRVGRITFASLAAYLVSQLHDVWMFHMISDKTKGKHLWLRNNVATIISQLYDTIIFIVLAFYGTMPSSVIVNMILSQWLVKTVIALADTPFCYLLISWYTLLPTFSDWDEDHFD